MRGEGLTTAFLPRLFMYGGMAAELTTAARFLFRQFL